MRFIFKSYIKCTIVIISSVSYTYIFYINAINT